MFFFTLNTGLQTWILFYLKFQIALAETCEFTFATRVKQIHWDLWSDFVFSLYEFRKGRIRIWNCPLKFGPYQHTPVYFRVHLELAYWSFPFTLSSNKDSMLSFDANNYYKALDIVQKSQQFYTSDSGFGELLTENVTFPSKCQAQWLLPIRCAKRPVHAMVSLLGHRCPHIFLDSLVSYSR